jgi:AAA15 family ATPase/GTPase
MNQRDLKMNNQLFMFNDDDSGPERYPTAFLPPDPQAPHLKRIEIKAFKGIKEQQIEFPKIAILTGPNNSGKSAILQAIVTGFECFRLCLDTDRWKLQKSGRAIKELDFLPVNQPKDLWFQTKTRKPREANESRPKEQYVSISLFFTNDFFFTVNIRFLYGFLNVQVTKVSNNTTEEILRQISILSPLLVSGVSGLTAHEPLLTPIEVHRAASSGRLSIILRNVLLDLLLKQKKISSKPSDQNNETAENEFGFVRGAIKRHFGLELQRINFDQLRDLEIRAPYREQDYELDIVSAGSGFIQILQLVSFIVWRKSRIILFDEPDSHLHTSLQFKLYNFLKELSDKMNLQMILATHSRDLISQAPMECIIPVDPNKTKLAPIQSMDHLLLEYKRYGAISNVDLALLYRSKRCLFVEGPSDMKYLPLFADRVGINCFQGPEQVVMFKFSGAEKFTMVHDLVKLFEKVVGSHIRWMVLRDRDYAIPSVVEKYKEQALEKGISNFHIWEKFCIENYLLEPDCLGATVSRKLELTKKRVVSQDDIVKLLEDACDNLREEVQTQYVTKTQDIYRRLEISQNWKDDSVRDALNFWNDNTKNLQGCLINLPGDQIFGRFVGQLQEKFGVNLGQEEVIFAMAKDIVPKEIRIFLESLNNL